MISVIVPVYNEEGILSKNTSFFENLASHADLIFVDGGSIDSSFSLATNISTTICSKKGRALQMNAGSEIAKGDILFFLHADAEISKDDLEAVEKELKKSEVIGGCLTQTIDKKELLYRFIEGFGNIRARFSRVFYGDQGIFVRKDVFLRLGGFPEVPVMEDVLFTKKMRACGKTIVLPNNILVSPRRWEKKGILRTAFIYSYINILFCMGVSLEKIKERYEDLR